jgi:hypothetical protein
MCDLLVFTSVAEHSLIRVKDQEHSRPSLTKSFVIVFECVTCKLFCNPENVCFSNDDKQLNASIIFDQGTCIIRTAIPYVTRCAGLSSTPVLPLYRTLHHIHISYCDVEPTSNIATNYVWISLCDLLYEQTQSTSSIHCEFWYLTIYSIWLPVLNWKYSDVTRFCSSIVAMWKKYTYTCLLSCYFRDRMMSVHVRYDVTVSSETLFHIVFIIHCIERLLILMVIFLLHICGIIYKIPISWLPSVKVVKPWCRNN